MRIIFIHQNMPGQYRGLMPRFAADPANQVVAIGDAANIPRNFAKAPEQVRLLGYQMPRLPKLVGHPFLAQAEHYTYRGERLARTLVELKTEGFRPDVICSHPGWGESLYIKDVFPEARLINYCEFFYDAHGRDFNFDPELPEPPFSEWGMRTRNAIQLLALNAMDEGVSPMAWQAQAYPREYQSRISVVHEGVDTKRVAPDPKAFVALHGKNLTLTTEDEVVTFICRNLEPYRGFHIFMRALPEILKARPKAHVILVGGDEVSYGKPLAKGTYREWMLREVGAKLDPARVHFTGKIPYADFLRVLQISSAHVYLSYPFVLSWSMLEAMAAGCLIIGSRTPPVEEVIRHEKNGLLVDFFSPSEIVAAVNRAFEEKSAMRKLRKKARETIIQSYDFETVCLPQHMRLISGA